MGGCSSASSLVSEEEDGSVNITVITVVIKFTDIRLSLVRRMVSEYP